MKRTFRWTTLACFSLLAAANGCSCGPDQGEPGSIQGRVFNALTVSGLEGAVVKVGDVQVTTDAAGSFTLAEVPSGDGVVVTIEKPGFARQIVDWRQVPHPRNCRGAVPHPVPRVEMIGSRLRDGENSLSHALPTPPAGGRVVSSSAGSTRPGKVPAGKRFPRSIAPAARKSQRLRYGSAKRSR